MAIFAPRAKTVKKCHFSLFCEWKPKKIDFFPDPENPVFFRGGKSAFFSHLRKFWPFFFGVFSTYICVGWRNRKKPGAPRFSEFANFAKNHGFWPPTCFRTSSGGPKPVPGAQNRSRGAKNRSGGPKPGPGGQKPVPGVKIGVPGQNLAEIGVWDLFSAKIPDFWWFFRGFLPVI